MGISPRHFYDHMLEISWFVHCVPIVYDHALWDVSPPIKFPFINYVIITKGCLNSHVKKFENKNSHVKIVPMFHVMLE
jgi:hypothetical protein